MLGLIFDRFKLVAPALGTCMAMTIADFDSEAGGVSVFMLHIVSLAFLVLTNLMTLSKHKILEHCVEFQTIEKCMNKRKILNLIFKPS